MIHQTRRQGHYWIYMIVRIIKILLGILLVPIAVGASVNFYQLLNDLDFGLKLHPAIVYGFLSYIPIHILFHRPILAHPSVHELTRRLGVIVPYLFPFYSYILLALYGIFIALGIRLKVYLYICFASGMTISFHILYLGYSIIKRQGELGKSGLILSVVLIFIFNIFFMVLLLKILSSGRIDLMDRIKEAYNYSIRLEHDAFEC